jgi:hypothetical protein
MRQLLILGFYCNVYRKEPRCRVYANDVLLDEFDIPHTPNKEPGISTSILDPLFRKNYQTSVLNAFKTNSPFLKYIDFDDSDTDILNIKLKIQNDDNNYNNGFMTKYTHITLPYVYLLSKKSLKNIKDIKNNYKYSRQKWEKYSYSNILNFYSNRLDLFNNLIPFAKLNFPNIKVKNYKKQKYTIGSTGYFQLTLQKKLGFWKPNTDVYKGYWWIGVTEFIEYFYDKYKQYENQRSVNT